MYFWFLCDNRFSSNVRGLAFYYATLRLHFTNNPFFPTLCSGLHPCLLHLSWSCTCIWGTGLPWRGAMSSTCSPPSPDTSDCTPPSSAHLHDLLIPPFQLFGHFCEDSESKCLDLNNLYFENLWFFFANVNFYPTWYFFPNKIIIFSSCWRKIFVTSKHIHSVHRFCDIGLNYPHSQPVYCDR